MKFTVATKPLSDSLSIAVVNQNVSTFYMKSCILQITADNDTLHINVEANRIVSEVTLKGHPEEGTYSTIFVDSLLFKSLISTLSSSSVTLEFTDTGLTVHSDKSKYSVPKMFIEDELDLSRPTEFSETEILPISKEDWKYIKDNQSYALAMSFIHPVYTYIYTNSDKDVLVGDFDNSLFTHSKKGCLPENCLLTPTILNMMTTLPEKSTLSRNSSGSYTIRSSTDGYTFVSEFTPKHEEDEDTGDYNANIILSMLNHKDYTGIKVKKSIMQQYISRAELLSSDSDSTIQLKVDGKELMLHDDKVTGVISVDNPDSVSFAADLKLKLFKSVVSSFPSDDIIIYPYKQDDVISGVLFWDKDMTCVLAVTEE